MRAHFDFMIINRLKVDILYINQSINLLINPFFYDYIILVEHTARFGDWTNSSSSKQAK